jgi:hypothetical protein
MGRGKGFNIYGNIKGKMLREKSQGHMAPDQMVARPDSAASLRRINRAFKASARRARFGAKFQGEFSLVAVAASTTTTAAAAAAAISAIASTTGSASAATAFGLGPSFVDVDGASAD